MALRFHPSFPWRALALAALTVLTTGTALAQWQWVDSTGRKVFSDTPPPASVPDKSILKRPGTQPMPAPVSAAAPSTPVGSVTTALPRPAGRDDQLEAKKKQAEDAEKAKAKADAERVAQARAENCERAKRAKSTLDSGVRIATTNSKGEREIMDDKARSSEAQRLDQIVRADCGPLPAPATAQ